MFDIIWDGTIGLTADRPPTEGWCKETYQFQLPWILIVQVDLFLLIWLTCIKFCRVEEKFRELESDQIEGGEFEFLGLEDRFERYKRRKFWNAEIEILEPKSKITKFHNRSLLFLSNLVSKPKNSNSPASIWSESSSLNFSSTKSWFSLGW